MAGTEILAIILIVAFFLIYAILLFSIIRAGTRGTFNWFVVTVAAIIGLLLITFLIANINNIVPADWAQILILLGLVGVTGFYALSATRQAQESKRMAEEMREQRIMSSRPLIIQKAIHEEDIKILRVVKEKDTLETPDYFSHFEVFNTGNGPAIELEISLLNKEKTPIQSHRESFLRAGEPSIKFRPFNIGYLEESTTYYLACEYQNIFSRDPQQTWYQTWLPFEPVKASKEDKIYVKPGELEFREVSEKDRIDAFSSRSKPK